MPSALPSPPLSGDERDPFAESTVSSKLQAAAPSSPDESPFQIASQILSVLSRYSLCSPKNGLENFLPSIYGLVRQGKTVQFCLPAFPAKSPNRSKKVLGLLPDKAEEYGLAHLNGLCSAIEDIYAPGAKLTIISDGIVYNDLLGVPDKDVWAYGEALREMAEEKKFKNIDFARIQDLLPVEVPAVLDEITYCSNATQFRFALFNHFNRPSFDPAQKIAADEDICMTYQGYLKFLESDLEDVYPIGPNRSRSRFHKGVKTIAKQMLTRGDAYARAIRERFPDYIRLSIHHSTGQKKISISLLPTESVFTTPWHCCIAIRTDGTVLSGPRENFDADSNFELIYENGRPSYFREKSDLYNWTTGSGRVTFQPQYPCGMIIQPEADAGNMTIDDIDLAKVRALSEVVSPICLRGFSKTCKRDLFEKKAHEIGSPVAWPYGILLPVKEQGAKDGWNNSQLSTEGLPFHYDGIFKLEKKQTEDGKEELVSSPPRFQLFSCVTPSPSDTGFTLFSTSTMMFKYGPGENFLEQIEQLTFHASTSAFGSPVLSGLPLVIKHPTTQRPCLRYHENWPQHKTRYDAINVGIDNQSVSESESLCNILNSLLRDRRVTYYHTWKKGDVVVSDNTLAMHTRSEFKAGSTRELWRIHFD